MIEARLRSVETPGFLTLEIDNGLLEQGKFALKKAKGVFPDGTAFSMPEDIPLPPPLVLGEGCRESGVPVRADGHCRQCPDRSYP